MILFEYLRADWQTMNLSFKTPSIFRLFCFFIVSYSFRVIVRMRLAHFLGRKKGLFRIRNFISIFLYWMNLRRGVDVHRKAVIGKGLRLPHPIGIVVGVDVRIGKFSYLLQNTTIGGMSGKIREDGEVIQTMPWLGDFVIIGAGATLLGPIRIGDYAQVGANAVVTSDIPRSTAAVASLAEKRSLANTSSPLSQLYEMIEIDINKSAKI